MGEMVRKAVRSSLWVFWLSVASAGMAYLARLVLARTISQADYGIFYAIFSLLGLLAIFKDLGLNRAMAKFLPEAIADRNLARVKSIIVLVAIIQGAASLFVTVALIILSPWIAEQYFHTPHAALPLIILAIAYWFNHVENVVRFAFQGFQKLAHYALIDFLRMAGILLAIVLLRNRYEGIYLPAMAYLFIYVLLPILIFWPMFLSKTFPSFFRTRAAYSKQLVRQLLRFGLPTMIGIAGTVVMAYLDTLMLAYFRPASEVALYQAASPTAKLLLYFAEAISVVMFPLASELHYKKRQQELRQGLEAAWKYALIVIIPLALILVSHPTAYLTLLFGSAYAGGAPALQILSIGAIVYTIAFLNTAIITAIGRPGISTAIIGIAALINAVLNVLLVGPYGLVGVSFATLISYGLVLILSILKVRTLVGITCPWFQWLKLSLCGLVFFGLISWIRPHIGFEMILNEIVVIVISGIVYLALLFGMRILTGKEIQEFLAHLRHRA